MGYYDINKHNRRIFPWFWQTPNNMALIDVITDAMFGLINDNYETEQASYLQRVGYSIQRLSLETSLNNRFDDISKRIVVINAASSGGGGYIFNESETIPENLQKYATNEAETLPTGLSDLYFFNENEAAGSAVGAFSVIAPLVIESSENNIRAWIEAVQITGTEYDLIFI